MLKALTVTALAICTSFQLYAQGYIVPNGVTYTGDSGFGAEIHVLQNPTNGDYTGFSLTPQGKTPPTVYTNTFLFNPLLDEGVRTFLVSSNAPISLQPILASSYLELTYPNNSIFTNGVPFYLAFYTGYNPWDSHGDYTGIYTDPLFGWGKFVNNQGVIQMLDSALEYGGGGIFAGTQTIIPEPDGFLLVGVGGLLFGLRRLRNSSQ